MRGFNIAVVLVVAAISLAGCAGQSRTYPTWKGAQLDDLISSWGPPDRLSTLPNGNRVAAYSENIGSETRFWGVRSKNVYCDIEWWGGVDGVINKFRWRGNAGICKKMILKRGSGPNQRPEILWHKGNRFRVPLVYQQANAS